MGVPLKQIIISPSNNIKKTKLSSQLVTQLLKKF
jgi:hypothetical protein